MSTLPASYRTLAEPLIARAREFLEAGESLVPFAFVGSFVTRQIVPVPLEGSDDRAKDAAAVTIRQTAEALGADFVFLVMESWGLPADKIDRVEAIVAEYGSVGASPWAVDAVSFSLETRHGLWFAQVPIRPKGRSRKRRTFGAVQFRYFAEVEGSAGRPAAPGRRRGAATGPPALSAAPRAATSPATDGGTTWSPSDGSTSRQLPSVRSNAKVLASLP